ncbi:MAG: DUF11 domain-containing protein [Candidatus Wallbacteria bacterium]|nr:DUF11 domain-containing protein [Candidatus Wallbacteria bacterium]
MTSPFNVLRFTPGRTLLFQALALPVLMLAAASPSMAQNTGNSSISLTASPSNPEPGQTVTYDITVSNLNTQDDFIFMRGDWTVTLPPDTTFVAGSAKQAGVANLDSDPVDFSAVGDSAFDSSTNTIKFGSGLIPPRHYIRAQFQVKVSDSASTTERCRQATLTAVNSFDSADTAVKQSADACFTPKPSAPAATLTLAKKVEPAGALPGDTVTYTIDYENTGNLEAISAKITDAIPSGLSFVSGSLKFGTKTLTDGADTDEGDFGATTAGAASFNVGTVAIGGKGSVAFQATVASSALVGNLNNIGTAVCEGPGPRGPFFTPSVALAISQSYGVDLSPKSGDFAGVDSQVVNVPATITNTGNGADTIGLTAIRDNNPSNPIVVILDADGDGIRDSNENTEITDTGSLPAGGAKKVFLSFTPTGSNGKVFQLVLIATSQGNSSKSANGAYTVTLRQADLQLVKGVSPSNPAAGATVTYTIAYKNNGAVTAFASGISDTLDASLAYVAGSLKTGTTTAAATSLTDASDSDGGSVSGQNLEVVLGPVTAGAAGVVVFKATVNAMTAPSSEIGNIANTRFNSPEDFPRGPVPSTNVTFAVVAPVASVEVTPPTSGLKGSPGTKVAYAATVTNTGNTDDNFDLTTSGLPTGWTAKVFEDTDEDGILDVEEITEATSTGSLPPAGSKKLLVQVSIPSNASPASLGELTLKATSQDDSTKFDTGVYTTTATGFGVSVTPPTTTLSAPPGGKTTYIIEIGNPGTGTDTYSINLTGVPPGYTPKIFEDTDGDGVHDPGEDKEITEAGPIPPGGGTKIIVVITYPPTAPPGDVFFPEIIITSGGDPTKNRTVEITGNVVGASVDVTPATSTSNGLAGGKVSYPATIANKGTDPDTIGLGTSGLPPGWTAKIFEDTDGDGVLDPGETTELTSTGALDPKDDKKVIIQVTVPPGAKPNETGPVTLTATSGNDKTKSDTGVYTTTVTGASVDVTPPTSTSSGKPGGKVNYPVVVKNDGSDPDTIGFGTSGLPSGYSVIVFEDTNGDGTLGPDETTELTATGPLPPGGSKKLIVQVTVPTNAPPNDTAPLTFTATSGSDDSKSDTSVLTTTVSGASVEVTPPTTTLSAPPGGKTTYIITVGNPGTEPDTYDINLTGVPPGYTPKIFEDTDGDGVHDPGEDKEITKLGPIPPGGGKKFIVVITYPPTASPGDTITPEVVVTSGKDTTQVDGTKITGKVVGASVDLTPPTSTSNGTAGGTVNFPARLSNKGTDPDTIGLGTSGLPAGWTAKIFEDTDEDGVLDPEETTVITSLGVLDPKDRKRVIVQVTVPPGASPNDIGTLTLTATSGNDPTKTDTGVYTTTVKGASVDVTPPTSTSSGTPGGKVNYPVVVKNDGSDTDTINVGTSGLPSGYTAKILEDTNGDGTLGPDETIEVTTTGPLPPGGTKKLIVQVLIPPNAPPGDSAPLTFTGTSTKDPERKDTAVLTTALKSAQVDLSPSVADGSGRAGGTVDYPFTVTNKGFSLDTMGLGFSGLPTGWTAKLFKDTDGDGILDPEETTEVTSTGSLQKEGSYKAIARVSIPAGAKEGDTGAISVKATSKNDPTRSDTGVYTTTVTAANVVVTTTVSPPKRKKGETVLVTVRFKNIGTAPASDVVIRTSVPPGLTYKPGTIKRGATSETTAPRTDGPDGDDATFGGPGTGSVTGTVDLIPPGDGGVITFEAIVDDNVPPGTEIPVSSEVEFDSPKGTRRGPFDGPGAVVTVDGPVKIARIDVTAEPPVIIGDGVKTSTITAKVFLSDGSPVPDGTPVKLTIPFGEIVGAPSATPREFSGVTLGGKVSFLVRGNLVGTTPREEIAVVTAGTPETGETSAEVKLIFTPAAVIGVLRSGGAPVANATIVLVNSITKQEITAETDADGRYFVPVSFANAFSVRVTKQNAFGVMVAVEVEGTIQALGETAFPKGSITGTLVRRQTQAGKTGFGRQSDRIVTGCTVTLFRTDGGTREVDRRVTGPDGVYRFINLEKGDYVLVTTDCEGLDPAPRVSRTVPLQDSGEVRLDEDLFLGAPAPAVLLITKRANQTVASPGDILSYQIDVQNLSGVVATGVVVTDTPPPSFTLLAGSATVNGTRVADPAGRGTFTIPVPNIAGGTTAVITYRLAVGPNADRSRSVNSATVVATIGGASVVSGPAQASVEINKGIFYEESILVGRVYVDKDGDGRFTDGDEPVANARVWVEDGTSVFTDRQGHYSIEGLSVERHAIMLDPKSLPGDRGNLRPRKGEYMDLGNPWSRLTLGRVGTLIRVDFPLEIVGQTPMEGSLVPLTPAPATASVSATGPGVATAGTSGSMPLAAGNMASRIDRSTPPTSPSLVGAEHLVAGGLSPAKVAGEPARLEIRNETGSLVADGQRRGKVLVDVSDSSGAPVADGKHVTVALSGAVATTLDADPERDGLQVPVRDGRAVVELEPGAQSGGFEVSAQCERVRATRQLRFDADLRDMVMFGVGSLELGNRTVRGTPDGFADLRELQPGGYDRSRAAVFAKGRVMDDYLLTFAFDSAKDSRQRIFRDIDVDRFYPMYGDSSRIDRDAQSASKLYLKLERGEDYLLWGDYHTAFQDNELAAYNRRFTGFKAEKHDEDFDLTLIANESDQRQVRDLIRGGGNSGPYFLSATSLLIGSEQLRIEVRDRRFIEVVREARTLVRNVDYTINYFEGTILFKEPVPFETSAFEPVFIVAHYEVRPGAGAPKQTVLGGRGRLRVGDHLTLGATRISEDDRLENFDLSGLDAALDLGRFTLKAEWAETDSLTARRGEGYRLHLSGKIDDVWQVDAIYRNLDGTYRNLSNQIADPGEERFGLTLQGRPSDDTRYLASYTKRHNALRGEDSEGASVEAVHQIEKDLSVTAGVEKLDRTLQAGLTPPAALANPRPFNDYPTFGQFGLATPVSGSNWIGRLGVEKKTSDRLSLRAEREQPLSGSDATFPSANTLSARYALTADTSLVAAGRNESFGSFDRNLGSLGVETRLDGDTFAFSRYTLQEQERGLENFASYGVKTRRQIFRDLGASVSYETAKQIDGDSPVDFDAVGLALTYTTPEQDKNASARLERRFGSAGTAALMEFGVGYHVTDGHSLMGKVLFTDTESTPINGPASVLFRARERLDTILAWAYRPTWTDLFDALFQYRKRNELSTLAGVPLDSEADIFSLDVHVRPTDDLFVDLRHAEKFAEDRSGGILSSVTSELDALRVGVQVAPKVDFAVEGRRLDQGVTGETLEGYGVEVGYEVIENVRVAGGYNFSGFDDPDLTLGHYTAKGPVARIDFKLTRF